MLESEFRVFLEKEGITQNGINSRLSKGRAAEAILGYSFGMAVSEDDKMYNSLVVLRSYDNPKNNPMQNALRKYYEFKNGRRFPQLHLYRR